MAAKLAALDEFSELPLLDGFKSVNYVEALRSLPKIEGLHAIRLITILPGVPEDEIHCTMSRHFIDEAGEFETLSYTWKGAAFTQPLTLNNDRFLVTSSVESALKHLRYMDRQRTVWIDSICIDQRNVIEKNAQKVIAWIGMEDEDEDDVGDTKLDVGGAFALANEIGKEGWAKYPEVIKRHSELALFSLTRLSDRSYFRRQWVIQEISLSREIIVMCGPHAIHWNALSEAAEGMRCFGQDPRANLLFGGTRRIWDLFGIRAMEFCREKSVAGHFSNDLLELLQTTRGREATDPRDMVYSLMGICGPDSMPIDVDYLARDSILQSLNLNFLRMCDHWSRDEGLPSWTVNWTHIWAGQWMNRSLDFLPRPPAKARLDPRSDDLVFSEDLTLLTIRGHLVDEIALCQDHATMPQNPDNSIGDDEIYILLRETFSSSEKLCTEIKRPDQSPSARRAEFTDFSKEDFADLYDKILVGHVPEADRKFWNKYSLKLVRFLADARFFVTKGAVIGLAERVCDFKQGDLLISFKGCSAESVLIIRRVDEKFELISGLYLHLSPEEQVAHEKMVDDLNDGVLKAEKYTLL
ncbi:HET domain-containing protein [Stipitochalara longipes BDJ]|nr:HET domain-containing protein [Stipitochalara longipes BDJ]